MPAPTTRNLAILLTDIKGFTDKTSHRSRADIQRLLDEHREVVLPVLQAKGGRLVKTIGDAFLMTYESPTDAVLSGIAAQEALARRNAPLEAEDRIEIRIAINTGEVNLVEGDVFGEPVNIASRIESVTEAGEVYFTEAVYLAMNKTEVPSSEVGLLQLKGIPEKIRVYKVRHETPLGVGQAPGRKPAAATGGFAPGEKARLAPAGAAVGGSAAPGGRPITVPKRAAGLVIDAILCGLLIGAFSPKSESVNLQLRRDGKAPAAGARAREGKSKVALSPAGIKVEDDGVHVSLDGAGLQVRTAKEKAASEEVLVKDGKWKVTRERKEKSVAFPIVWVLYNTLFLFYFGATPGKKVIKARVLTASGEPLDWKHAVARSLSSLFSGYVLFLGFAWAGWERERRTWHDLIAGTRVVPAE